MKITVFVVKDNWNCVINVVASMDEAIACAVENDSIETFEAFTGSWMEHHCADDFLDLLEEKNPMEALKRAYRREVIEKIEDGDCEAIESFEVEIPIDKATITPEVMVAITKIFTCS